jgi:DNA-binding MarR family transcriptional regulator
MKLIARIELRDQKANAKHEPANPRAKGPAKYETSRSKKIVDQWHQHDSIHHHTGGNRQCTANRSYGTSLPRFPVKAAFLSIAQHSITLCFMGKSNSLATALDSRPSAKEACEILTEIACTNTVLRRAARRLSQLYDEALAPLNLKATQNSLLTEIRRSIAEGYEEGPALQDLAGKLAIQISALTHALKPLVRDGLIEVRPDARDGRRKHGILTPLGRKRLTEAQELWAGANDRVEDSFWVPILPGRCVRLPTRWPPRNFSRHMSVATICARRDMNSAGRGHLGTSIADNSCISSARHDQVRHVREPATQIRMEFDRLTASSLNV